MTKVVKMKEAVRTRPSIERKADLSPDKIARNYISRNNQENLFEPLYNDGTAVIPPYDFATLYTIKEDSDALTACVDAMKYNIEGFGYDIVWVGDNSEEQTSPQAQKEYVKLFNFFDSINEDEGYTKIAVKKREDLETVGKF